MFLFLQPAEVVTEILSWLKVEDCRQLACCSKHSYDIVKPQIWNRVKIDSSLLYDLPVVRQHIQYIDLATQLCFKDTNWSIPEEQKHVLDNLEYVLDHCNPAKIMSFELLSNACGDSWAAGLEDILMDHLSK